MTVACARADAAPITHAAPAATAPTLQSLTYRDATLDAPVTRSVEDAIDRVGLVVAHQNGPVLVHHDVHRTPPPAAVGPLPTRDEILVRHRQAVRDVHAHHFGARRSEERRVG